MNIGEPLRFLGSIQFWRMAVLWTLSLVYSYFRLFIRKWSHCSTSSYSHAITSPPAHGALPVCVITGATSGLGRSAALALSLHGFYVVLAGRSSLLLSQTMLEIRKENPGAHLKAFKLDLRSFESISLFKNSLQEWLVESDMHCSIQLLINNAAILATSCRRTAEGYDEMMVTNFIGPFLLTENLLPLLRNSPSGSRIVNVTSFTHQSVFSLQVDKETVTGVRFHGSNQYPYAQIYEHSKMYVLLFTYQLHKELCRTEKTSKISVIAADPGAVATNIMREFPSQISSFAHLMLKLLGLMQPPAMGISSLLDAALASPEASGQYFFGGCGKTLRSSSLSYDKRLAEQLWEVSCALYEEFLSTPEKR